MFARSSIGQSLLALSVSLCAAACGQGASTPGDGPDASPSSTRLRSLRLELGTGIESFTPLQPTNTIFLVHGPQGGQHVNGNLRIHSVGWSQEELEALELEFTIETLEGELGSEAVGAFSPRLAELESDLHTLELGRYVYMKGLAAYEMHRNLVRYCVIATDEEGTRVASECRTVLFVDPLLESGDLATSRSPLEFDRRASRD